MHYFLASLLDITERKEAEKKLRESEERYRLISENSADVIWVLDPIAGRFTYVSPSVEKLRGYTPAEVMAQPVSESLTPESLKMVSEGLAERLPIFIARGTGTESFVDEVDQPHKDGSIVHTEVTTTYMFNQQGRVEIIGISRDITDRKKAEEALRRNEHVLRLFVEHSPASIAMFDRDMRYIVASHRFLIDYEIPPQDLTGRSHYDVFPEIPERWKNIHRRCLQGSTEMAEEDPFPRSNGKMDWVRWEIRPWYEEPEKIGGVILFSEVITDRKLSKQALQQSDERHRLISSLTSDYVYSGITLPDGAVQIEWISGAFEQITGYDLEEVNLLPNGFASLVLPDDLTSVMKNQILVLEGGSTPTEYRIRRKDGEIRWLLDYVHYVPGAESRTKLLGAVQDITQRKRAEEALYKLNAELEQRVLDRTLELSRANRAKDEFLANMSHELRTPLNTVLGLSESLLEQRSGSLNGRQVQSLELISSSGRHLLSLINDILEVSKIEAGKLELHPVVVSVKELCESSMNFIKQMALKKRITLQFNHEGTVARVYADPQRLKQILINLLMNAVKFTPEHGQVTLDVYPNAEQDQIMFAISDTGIGIKEDDLKKLFTPFTQLDSSLARQYAGTGLGLALVHKLTDLHGGSVHVESEQDKGSRFTVILPLPQNIHELIASERPALPAYWQQPSIAPSTSPQGHILLAEDNEINAGMLSEYLIANGYSVVTVQNGEDALQKAEEIDPCIILMDIQMPKMDGLEAMRRLRANPRFASTPIIALTALAMPGDKERCFEAGANEYMSKPVSLRNVVQLIKKLTEPAE